MIRFWDGRQWTAAQQPMRPVPPPKPRPPVPPHAGRNERLGRIALVARAGVLILAAAATGIAYDYLLRYFDLVTTQPGQPPSLDVAGFARNGLLVAGASALIWASIAALAVWTHRCATAGAALGIPARFEPAWGTVGWFIPFLNYWFPYQAVRDSLPPDHPRRRDAAWWWGLDIAAAQLVQVVALIAVAATMLGLRVAAGIDEAHRAAKPTADQPV
jgi:hypothetical protein